MCMSKRQYSTMKFAGEFVGLVGRVLKSFLFNLLVFIVGFSLAYIFVVSHVQMKAKKSVDVQFVQQLEKDLEQQKKIVEKLEQQVKEYKDKLSPIPVSEDQ